MNVFQKGSDVFWTSRSRWERHFLSPTYGVLQPLRILWCIRHKQFLTMLAYFIWMCFWFLYRNGSRSRSYIRILALSFSFCISIFLFSLRLSLSFIRVCSFFFLYVETLSTIFACVAFCLLCFVNYFPRYARSITINNFAVTITYLYGYVCSFFFALIDL